MLTHLAALFSSANALVFFFPGKLIGCRYYSLLGGKSVAFAEIATPAAGPSDVMALRDKLGVRPEDVWGVGLPLNGFSMVNLQLPSAAEDDLGQAVRYALMRHLPYDVGSSVVSWAAMARQDKHISVTAVAAPTQKVEQTLRIVGDLPVAAVFPGLFALAMVHGQDGVYLAGGAEGMETVCLFRSKPIFHHWAGAAEADEGSAEAARGEVRALLDNLSPGVDAAFLCTDGLDRGEIAHELGFSDTSVHSVTMVELSFPGDPRGLPGAVHRDSADAARQRSRRLAWVQAAALALLLLSLVSIPAAQLLGKSARVTALEEDIAAIRHEGEQQLALRDQNESAIVFLHDLGTLLDDRTQMSDLLLETTSRLPNTIWLTSLGYSGRTLRIQGLADSAAAVIEALDNSPWFRDVRLESPVTKTGDKDTFHVSASIEP